MTPPEGVFVHPDGRCESDTVGAGTRVWAFAHVLAGAVVGAGCNLCDHTYVERGAVIGDNVTVKNGVQIFDMVTLEDHVFVGPNATFTNDQRPRSAVKKDRSAFLPTLVRRGATIGANATVVCGVEVGEAAFVAAGAVVTRHVPAHALVAGSPAVRDCWVCDCGEPLQDDLSCPVCGLGYRMIDEARGLAAL